MVEQVSYLTRIAPTTLANVTALSAAVVLATGDRRVRFTYDAAQRLRLKADGTGAVTQYTYDGIGNVVKEVEFATRIAVTGAVTTPAANAATDHVTLHTYDAAGRRSASIDALGGVTAFKYDAKGNLVQRLEYAGRSTLLPLLASTTANAATMVSQAAASAGSTAALNHVWRQAYDTAPAGVRNPIPSLGLRDFLKAEPEFSARTRSDSLTNSMGWSEPLLKSEVPVGSTRANPRTGH